MKKYILLLCIAFLFLLASCSTNELVSQHIEQQDTAGEISEQHEEVVSQQPFEKTPASMFNEYIYTTHENKYEFVRSSLNGNLFEITYCGDPEDLEKYNEEVYNDMLTISHRLKYILLYFGINDDFYLSLISPLCEEVVLYMTTNETVDFVAYDYGTVHLDGVYHEYEDVSGTTK